MPEGGAAGAIEDLDGEAGIARPCGGGIGEHGGRQRAGGLVDEIARARDRARGRACARERGFAVVGGQQRRGAQHECGVAWAARLRSSVRYLSKR